MTPKDILTNKSFCPIPWTGFYIGPDGQVKNCICSWDDIGNTKENKIYLLFILSIKILVQ